VKERLLSLYRRSRGLVPHIAVAIMLVLLYANAIIQISSLKRERTELKDRLTSLTEQTKRYGGLEKELKRLQSSYRQTLNELISVDSEALLFASVQSIFSKLAADNGVDLRGIRLMGTRNLEDDLMETTIRLEATGNPRRMLDFLDAVESGMRKTGMYIKYINLVVRNNYVQGKRVPYMSIYANMGVLWIRSQKRQ